MAVEEKTCWSSSAKIGPSLSFPRAQLTNPVLNHGFHNMTQPYQQSEQTMFDPAITSLSSAGQIPLEPIA